MQKNVVKTLQNGDPLVFRRGVHLLNGRRPPELSLSLCVYAVRYALFVEVSFNIVHGSTHQQEVGQRNLEVHGKRGRQAIWCGHEIPEEDSLNGGE